MQTLSTPSSPSTCPHSSKLDVLRIIFCACVFYCHFHNPADIATGQVGVIGFFVMAGYLLQAAFERTPSGLNVTRFYRSKARRLLPAYVFATLFAIVLVILSALNKGEPFPLLNTSNPAFSPFQYITLYNIPSWYMGCLFLFILIAPFLFYLYHLRWGLPLFFAASFLYASFLYWHFDGTMCTRLGTQGELYTNPWARLWEFLAGMMAYKFFSKTDAMRHIPLRLPLACLILCSIVALTVYVSATYGHGYSLPNSYLYNVALVILMSLLIPMMADGKPCTSARITRTLTWIAGLTYPIYLLQMPCARFTGGIEQLVFHERFSHGTAALCTLSICVAISIAFSMGWERLTRKER